MRLSVYITLMSPGKWNGGDGVTRELIFRRTVQLSVLTERRAFQPYGMNGKYCHKMFTRFQIIFFVLFILKSKMRYHVTYDLIKVIMKYETSIAALEAFAWTKFFEGKRNFSNRFFLFNCSFLFSKKNFYIEIIVIFLNKNLYASINQYFKKDFQRMKPDNS